MESKYTPIKRRPLPPTTDKAGTTVLQQDYEYQQSSLPHGPIDHEGAISDIVLASSLIVVPMLALSAVFVALVFHQMIPVHAPRQGQDPFASASIVLNSTASITSAYYIDIDSTRLITVASWTSTVVTFLPVFVMLLVSYPIARKYLQLSYANDIDKLPTPYQVRILVEVLMGSVGSLLPWSRYRLRRSKTIFSGNSLVTTAVQMLLASMILGLSIIGVDTWLHLTTTTVELLETSAYAGSSHNFSRLLKPSCIMADQRPYPPCSVSPLAQGNTAGTVWGVSDSYRTLYNVSSTVQVLSTNVKGLEYAYFAAADLPSTRSYRATTFAMNTKCRPLTRSCNLHASSECPFSACTASMASTTMSFNCSKTFFGDITGYHPMSVVPFYNTSDSMKFFMAYFQDDNFTQYWDPRYESISQINGNATSYFSRNIPFHFTLSGVIDSTIELGNNPDFVFYSANQGLAFLIGCDAEIFEMAYTFSGGAVVEATFSPANATTIVGLTNPFALGAPGIDAIIGGVHRAGLSSDTDAFLASFAQTFSHTILSMGTYATVPGPSVRESVTTVKQVTRLPKVPFWTLIALNCLFAIFGAILAVVAACSDPKRTKNVQARLGLTGVFAALFEGHRANLPVKKLEDHFVELRVRTAASDGELNGVPGDQELRKKIAVMQTAEGGWRLQEIYPLQGWEVQ